MQHPGVAFPPPILFVIGVICGWLLNRLLPLPISEGGLSRSALILFGWSAVVIGLGVLAWALLTFWRARTAIYPNQPARTIVAHGPYRYSRNPMYVALAMLMAGVGVLLNSMWVLALIPVVLMALTVFVIRREEAYLSSAFGDNYAAYRAQVRRWL